MEFLEELAIAVQSVSDLEHFIEDHFNKIFDFFNLLKDQELVNRRHKVRDLQLSITIIESLDFTKEKNAAFLNLLLRVTIRLGLRLFFQRLYAFAKREELVVNRLIEASSYYMFGAPTTQDILDGYTKFIEELELVYLEEEDNQDFSLVALFNLYAWFVEQFVFATEPKKALRSKIWQTYQDDKHQFIRHPIVEAVYEVDISQVRPTRANDIRKVLEDFLGRDRTIGHFSTDTFIIESEGDYVGLFAQASCGFEVVQRIASSEYLKIKDDRIFRSLGRGVFVLDDPKQLLAYMYAYGNMHQAKLQSGYEALPSDVLAKTVEVVDWACGQAVATLSYIDFLQGQSCDLALIHQVTLIEPSEVALRRASFHVNCCLDGDKVKTVNKAFDHLYTGDVTHCSNHVTIHLFSNILDMNVFSHEKLIQFINATFRGRNVFVIVSPLVNNTKTMAIDAFVDSYSAKQGFNLLAEENNASGTWVAGKNWSRVLRVFEVYL